MKIVIEPRLIAPCGMNCALCSGFQRSKNKCDGCRGNSELLPKYCLICIIRNCDFYNNSAALFCYECPKYPCKRLKQLDKRYRTRYGMSMIVNLDFIKIRGIEEFISSEVLKWTCNNCGKLVSCHRSFCLSCKAQIK